MAEQSGQANIGFLIRNWQWVQRLPLQAFACTEQLSTENRGPLQSTQTVRSHSTQVARVPSSQPQMVQGGWGAARGEAAGAVFSFLASPAFFGGVTYPEVSE